VSIDNETVLIAALLDYLLMQIPATKQARAMQIPATKQARPMQIPATKQARAMQIPSKQVPGTVFGIVFLKTFSKKLFFILL